MKTPAFIQLTVVQAKMLGRNVSFWMVSLLIAGLSMIVFGYLFRPDSRPFDLAIVDEDHTQMALALVNGFEDAENVDLSKQSRADELRRFEDGKLAAVVIIPDGFGETLADGRAAVQVYFDTSDPVRASYAQTTVNAVVQAFSTKVVGDTAGVAIEALGEETRRVRFIDFLTPGMVGMTVMWTNLHVGHMLIGWREQGILRRLGTTPLRSSTLIASQAISFAGVSVVQSAIVLGLGALLFGVRVEGSILYLALTVFLGISAMLAIGYIISSFARSTTSANAFGQLVAFPMMFLGGSYFPMDPPAFLRPVVSAIPLTHLNDALREITNYGNGIESLSTDWLILLAWAIAGFVVSAKLFRWQ